MSSIPVVDKPEPSWLNKSAMAASCGVSVQAFDKWGVEPVAKCGRQVFFKVSDVIVNRVSNEILKHQPKPVSADQLEEGEMDYQRYRLTKAQADAQEMKNKVTEGINIPSDFVTFAISKIAPECVGVLDSLPLNFQRKHPEVTSLMLENLKRELSKASNLFIELPDKLPEFSHEYKQDAT